MKEKLRKQRENELKILEQKISVLMTENGKHFDTLEYMIKLREFLYKLMPQLKKEGDEVLAREKLIYLNRRVREMETTHKRRSGGDDHHHHEESKTRADVMEERKEKAAREFDQEFSQGFM